MLSIKNLSIAFDDKPILTDISFDVATGQIACLLGASGCGKTTILRCIAGFETPQAGSICIGEGVDAIIVSDSTQSVPAHLRKVGMVFQDYALFPHLTVAENIGFGLNTLSASDKRDRIDEMLTLINMQSYKNSYPHELSGGQQQRVALVRALAPHPSLILLDEPFSNLDVELRSSLSKEVRELLKSQNVSAILVTHDQAEAFAIADVVGMVADGQLAQWDTPSALYHTPASEAVARFIGEGVLFDIQHLADDAATYALGKVIVSDAKAGATKLLIRPHDVKPTKTDSDDGHISVTVTDKDFRGGSWLYTLSTADGSILLMQTSMAANHRSNEIGDQLQVMVRRACAL